MSDGVKADFSEMDKLAVDLGNVPASTAKNIRKAVEVGARNVKDSWREKLQGAEALPRAAASITYDINGNASSTGSELSADIGPELGGQGSLVGGVELGHLSNVSARGYGLKALQDEQADFEQGLDKAIDQALKDVGL